MKHILRADRSWKAARRLRLPLWRWCVRILLAAFVVYSAYFWVATIFMFAIVMVNWSQIMFHLVSGEAGIEYFLWVARIVALTVTGIWILAAVVSADKRTVLYMRRFRAQRPQARMRRTLEAGLGRRYRLVTLSDGVFQPLEVPPLERWFNRAVLPLLAVVFVLGSGMFVYLAPLVFFGAPLLLAPIIAGFLLLRYRVRRRARIAVATPSDLAGCVARVARLKRWWTRPSVLAPQATVVTVPDQLWQDGVAELSRSVDAVVVDVSSVSTNLLWELECLSASGFRRCVLIAEGDQLAAWSEDHGDPTAERCRALLKDQSVLVYRGNGLFDRRRFRRSLKRLLDQAVTDLWPIPTAASDRSEGPCGEAAPAMAGLNEGCRTPDRFLAA